MQMNCRLGIKVICMFSLRAILSTTYSDEPTHSCPRLPVLRPFSRLPTRLHQIDPPVLAPAHPFFTQFSTHCLLLVFARPCVFLLVTASSRSFRSSLFAYLQLF